MRRILAIDDQPDNLTTVKAVIKMLMPNIEVLTAQSGEQGILAAKENNPDVILLDIIMPKMDGYEVCKRLKADKKTSHIPVAMMTALKTDSESKVKALELGAEVFIAKPIESIELIAQLKVLLRAKEAEDKLREERDNLNETVRLRTKELAENEYKYRSLVESSQESILVLQKGTVQYVNPVSALLSGYKTEELIGSSFIQYVHEDDKESVLENYSRRAEGKNVHSQFEFRVVCKSGEILWFNLKANKIEWKNEMAFLYVLHDITEKKEIENQKWINSERDKVLLELYNKSLSTNDKEIFDFVIDKAVAITKSKIGFFHKFNEDLNTIDLTAWNVQALNHCKIPSVTHYPIDKAGNWVDCVREKKIIIYNDYSRSPNQKGLPDGHVQLKNYMSVPVILNNKVYYIFGIGNKEDDYNNNDKQNLQIIANELAKILEKRNYQKKIKESTEKYFAIHNNAPLPFQSLNENGNIVEVNPSWLNTLGYQKEEVIGRWYGDFLHEDYVPIFERSFPNLKKKGKVTNVLYQLKKKNGDYIDIKLDATSGYSSVGKFIQTYCTFINVTEELIQQKKLEESEIKYRSFVEQFQGIAFRKNNKQILDLIEGNVEGITGYKIEDFVSGKVSFDKIIHPEDFERIKTKDKNFIESDLINLNSEFRIINSNGTIRWISETTKKYKLNQQTWFYGTLQDVSHIKDAILMLEESNTFNQYLINTLPFPMEIVDETGKILFMNPVFEKLVGIENLGEKCWHVYRDDKEQCENCPLLKDFPIGQINITESTGVLGGRTFEITHRSMLFDGKKALMEIFIDVTERNKYEADLVIAKDKALESDKLKTAFLANMSHEIRTPMNGILGFLDLLDNVNISQTEREHFISIIKISGDRLLCTINDIIEISKIEAGGIPITLTEGNLGDNLNYLNRFFSIEAKAKGIELNSMDSDLYIRTDFSKLDSILTNLIKNAIKFTTEGSITFGYQQINNKLQFYVKDTGTGIAKEQLQIIFNRFIQADNSISRGYEGSGLGLSISKAYAGMLGGDIWVESEIGKGSTFFFTIDLIPTENAITYPQNSKQFKLHDDIPRSQILIAEDDEMSYLLLQSLMGSDNYELIRALNGAEAISKLKENPFVSLILMDLKMPVMDGIAATRQIRQFDTDIPIIAQTAFALLGDKEKALEAGCTDYVSKPIKKYQLMQLLEKYLK